MNFDLDAVDVLRKTSRTFFVPIIRLPQHLRNAVGSAYLCLRAIDEIEDHSGLDKDAKVDLLNRISRHFADTDNGGVSEQHLADLFAPHEKLLPQVTLELGRFALMAPMNIAARVWEATATMAREMADWVKSDFTIRTEADLDRYTFDVAGQVGLLLTDIWTWDTGVKPDREHAIGFGRGLQAVNIARNRDEDLARGVDFYPDGWTNEQMFPYIRRQLGMADRYIEELPRGAARDFCRIPLALAHATIGALEAGREKLTRSEVEQVIVAIEGT